jgi:hypothetical protein
MASYFFLNEKYGDLLGYVGKTFLRVLFTRPSTILVLLENMTAQLMANR